MKRLLNCRYTSYKMIDFVAMGPGIRQNGLTESFGFLCHSVGYDLNMRWRYFDGLFVAKCWIF